MLAVTAVLVLFAAPTMAGAAAYPGGGSTPTTAPNNGLFPGSGCNCPSTGTGSGTGTGGVGTTAYHPGLNGSGSLAFTGAEILGLILLALLLLAAGITAVRAGRAADAENP